MEHGVYNGGLPGSVEGSVAHLSLSLLGAFEATLDGAAITGFESARVRALLAYLVMEADRPHSREALAGLLWPDQPERDARNNLREALANLRTALNDRQAPAPFLLISRSAIQFDASREHRLDVAEFQRLIEAGQSTVHDGLVTVRHLQLAIDLYRGPLLQGFSVASPEFEAWLLLRQGQIEDQFLAALQRLAALYEARGEYEPAQACARRYLETVPWDEPAHRRLMRLLALAGRPAAALDQYRACRRVLAVELGIEPCAETRVLYEAIRVGDGLSAPGPGHSAPMDGRPWPTPPHPSPETLPPCPFVARERELAVLDGHLRRALAGQGRVALVSGEAGTGKTALLAEFARRALGAHRDLVVAGGNCSERLGQGDPYLPFREILQLLAGDVAVPRAGRPIPAEQAGRLWDLLPITVQALLAEGPDLIGRLVPGAALALRAEASCPGGAAWRSRLDEAILLARHRSPIEVEWPLPEASRGRDHGTHTPGREPAPVQAPIAPSPSQQAALFEQVTRVLGAIARQRPLVLVLDDLQWADAGSLALLFHLGRRLAGSRILLLVAYRPDDLSLPADGAEHPLEALARELRCESGEIGVDLEQAGGRPFVEALLDAEPNTLGESFRSQLCRVTGGHALFTVELVREMRERGSLVRDEAGRWTERMPLDWERPPPRVEAVIAGRVNRLPAGWQALLAAASVEGETFTAEVLARALSLDEAQVLGTLNGPLSRSRLVHAQSVEHLDGGQRLSHYRFQHALFHAYLYGRLNAVERARLHEAAGTALETLYQGEGDRLAALAPQLAWHFEQGGLADKAAGYLLQAGWRAHWLSAPQEAAALFRRGLALLENRAESDERARREVDLRLALDAALQDVSEWGAPERGTTLRRAHQLARRLGEPGRLLPALRALSHLVFVQGRYDEALALARQLLHLGEQVQEPAYAAWGEHMMGMSCVTLGDLAPARGHFEQALSRYRQRGAGELEPPYPQGFDVGVNIQAWLSYALWLLGLPDQSLAQGSEAVTRAEELADAPSLALALTIAGAVVHSLRREGGAVRESTERLQRLVLDKKLAAYEPWVDCFAGWLLVGQGRPAAGLAQMRAGMASLRTFRPFQLLLLAGACSQAGQIREGLEALDEALDLVEKTGARPHEAELHRLRGELLLREGGGRGQEAEACFRRALAVAGRQAARSWELRAAMSLARLWRAQGRRGEARAQLAGVYGWFSEGFGSPDLVEARALLEELE